MKLPTQRHQGRVFRFHFTCKAELPFGTTLRVTSSVGPPPHNDALDDVDVDDRSVSSEVFSIHGAAGGEGGSVTAGFARMHNRLLHNTVEMFTTPETYPLWKTKKPVVVIDDGNVGEGGDPACPMVHRYRYVAVTPGATIDWDLCTKRDHDDDGNSSMGRNTASTTPPGSDDERDGEDEHENLLHYEEDVVDEEEDYGYQFPPVLYENPSEELPGKPISNAGESSGENEKAIADTHEWNDGGMPKGHHKRTHSLFDAQGNPIELPTVLAHHQESPSLPVSTASFSSYTTENRPTVVLTWEAVSALPYRSRSVDVTNDGDHDIEIIDNWNDGSDPSFQSYWKSKADKAGNGVMTNTTVTQDGDNSTFVNEDDDLLDATDGKDVQRESIFIVCYHLPVILTRDPATSSWTACWSESLIAKSEIQSVSSTRKTVWVGTVSNIPQEFMKDEQERNAIRDVLKTMDCIPIFFVEEKYESVIEFMYLGFCKQVLWPSFHNVDLLDLATNGWGQRQRNTRADPVQACALAAAEARERKRSGSLGGAPPPGQASSSQQLRSDWDQGRLDKWWKAYQVVNRKFSQVVASLVSGGDIVWVHDYHLALLPRMLRESRNETSVVFERKKSHSSMIVQDDAVKPIRLVFFIHVPFPTSQVFRELEHGEALLEGMLHADVIGFHAFDHARHFLNAAKRILGLSHESLVGGLIGVRHRGTKVLVTVSNVSVETDIIDALLEFPSVKEDAAALQQKHAGRTIIAGIDVAQRLSGISLKLQAFERLLTDYPVWQSKVVLLQRCLIPGNRRVDEADTLREVRALVLRIKTKFGKNVIDYEEQVGSVLPIDQRLAIWTSSQVLMHMPIREGLNLCPLEFVYARKEPASPGVVIASEFSAVSSILNGALRVNPWDVLMSVTCIDSALSMSMSERDARRGRDIDFVSTCPSGLWTRNVLRDLNDATHEDSSKREVVGGNSPESILARELELSLESLDLRSLESAYKMTSKRVIIIDFNGTLVVKEPAGKYLKREILGTSGFKPSDIAAKALGVLCKDPCNTIYVVSGDSQQNLEVAVGDIAGLGLAASNGACFADPGGQERTWKYLDFGVDWQAVQKSAMPIISKFTARSNGSFVKLTHSSIGWSYYSCDPEWGSLQASHLVMELSEALQPFDVRFVALKGIVEVVPRKLNKGHIVKRILDDTQARNNGVDFVLCMGDDIADEKMFMSVTKFSGENENAFAFNVAVGKKPTNASFYVDDASSVTDVLVALSGDQIITRMNSIDTGASDEYFS
ncbi:hypothetical protein ACHAW6_014361 [Cyclotella cf. meneghiniana]